MSVGETEVMLDETLWRIALKRHVRQLSNEVSIKNIKMKIIHQKIR